MRARLARWLEPPALEDPEAARAAAVLHWILVSIIALIVCLAVTVLSRSVALHRGPVWICDGAMVLLAAGALVLLHRGHVQLAAVTFSSALWLVVTVSTFVFGGITSPTVTAYLTVSVLAGFFWGGRGIMGFSLLTGVTALGMVWADYAGIVPEPLSPITPINSWITLMLALFVTAMLLELSRRATDAALAEARRNERAHRESKERYRSLIEQSPDALFLHSDGRLLFANPALAELVGADSSAELVGRDVVDLVQATGGQAARQRTRAILLDTGSRSFVQDRWTVAPGRRLPVEIVSRTTRHEGRPAVQVLARNLSERVRLEEELRQAQKMEAIGRLAGGIAHDFNNLLMAISGHNRFLMQTLPESGPQREDAEEIAKAAKRAAALTQQLLAFSRKQVMRPVVFDLNATVREMEKMLTRLIGEKLTLVTRLDPEPGRVRADPGQLEQVIVNLVVNARDSMPRGGEIEIATAHREGPRPTGPECAGASGPWVELSVRDSGTGMDEETLAHIFDPFFTTKDRFKGTGLGLSTVYGIVKQSGGGIGVESEEGCGSTFRVWLPRCGQEPQVESRPVERPRGGDETLLLVEDEPRVRRLMRRLLDEAGYRVIEAHHGAHALALVAESDERIDLLVTDVVMPELGGGELARRLREIHPECRVLYVSGYTGDELDMEGVVASDAGFLPKPFRAEDLTAKVRELLEKRD